MTSRKTLMQESLNLPLLMYYKIFIKYFMGFLQHKELLNVIYTQNIDGLELKAGINKDKLVFAHGYLQEAHCFKCQNDVELSDLDKHIQEGKVLYCTICNTPCKNKVVFYGESLPKIFFQKKSLLEDSDCVFIMGTTLKVSPFNILPYIFSNSCFRVVVNKEKVGESTIIGSLETGFKYDDIESNDLFLEGFTDDGVMKLVDAVGWRSEYEEFVKKLNN